MEEQNSCESSVQYNSSQMDNTEPVQEKHLRHLDAIDYNRGSYTRQRTSTF